MTSPRAWGWLAHLRAGGTTDWSAWTDAGQPGTGRFPGAQHLELVRRLNLLGPTDPALVARVLASAGPGRGHQQLTLLGDDHPGFGTPPLDPTDLPAEELVRLASAVLADLVVERGVVPGPVPRPPLLRKRFVLYGDPWLVRSARDQLQAAGMPPGGRALRAIVVVSPVDDHLADIWTGLAVHTAVPRWSIWLSRLGGRLPARNDPVTLARELSRRRGRRRVHVCLGLDAVADVLGAELSDPPRLSHAAVDGLRRVWSVLRVVVGDDQARTFAASTLVPWLAAADDRGLPRPVVPPARQRWLHAEAKRWADSLAGYAVHGGGAGAGLADLVPGDPDRTTPPTDDEVLHVMVRALHENGS